MPADRFELDNGLGRGSFYAVLALYRRQAYIVIGVGLGLGMFSGWTHIDMAAILLFASAMMAWLLVTWMSWVYEMYLGMKYPKNIPLQRGQIIPLRDGPEGTMVGDFPPPVSYIGPTNYTLNKALITYLLAFGTVLTFILGLLSLLLGLINR